MVVLGGPVVPPAGGGTRGGFDERPGWPGICSSIVESGVENLKWSVLGISDDSGMEE
jgi:hypothetical protein